MTTVTARSKPRFEGMRRKHLTKAKQIAPPAQSKAKSRREKPLERTFSAGEYQAYGQSKWNAGAENERARVAAVVGSSASIGRERSALEMLAYGHDSSATIIAYLSALPTDRELKLQRAENRRRSNRKIWDKALGKNSTKGGKDSVMVAAMKGLRR